MGLFKSVLGSSSKSHHSDRDLGHSMQYSRIQDVFYAGAHNSDVYENVYASVRPYAYRFSAIRPFAVDKNAKVVENVPAVNAIYRPNKQFGFTQFLDTIAVGVLTQPEIYLLVWRREGKKVYPGGKITKDNIGGYTFLTGASKIVTMGEVSYRVTNSKGESLSYTENEVITLTDSRNPANLTTGYSPAQAADKWATIDDYIAAFQKGYFKNGAVPSGQFIITAPTGKEFNDIVDKMQERHRGAGKNNNVTYSHRPVDNTSGKPTDAQVEWVPFNVQNKDMELGTIFENTNKKIDSAYGVPAIVRGVDDSATYANAQVADKNFVMNRLEPFTNSIWSQWTHELNRITGGLGVAITFDLDIPVVADEEKVDAERKNLDSELIINMTEEGYSLDSIVDAFGLPESYKKLGQKKTSSDVSTEQPEIDEANEVATSPDSREVSKGAKQVSAREFPGLYDDLGVDMENLGCIMLDTEKLEVLNKVPEELHEGILTSTDRHSHKMGAVAESEPHITLLYGLLENGNTWKDKVDTVLSDWELENIKINEVGYFTIPEGFAVVAHIEKTKELIDGHERLTLLPHVNTFSEYKPHMTLAYLNKDADVAQWVHELGSVYNGKELKVTGINYGDPVKKEEAAKSTNPKAKQLNEDEFASYQQRLNQVIRASMQRQISSAASTVKAVGDATDEEVEQLADDMLTILMSVMLVEGAIQYTAALGILTDAGVPVANASQFLLTASQESAYRTYLTNVAKSYTRDTAVSIRNVLAQADAEGWSRSQLDSALKNIMSTDEWRVLRLSRSELNRSQQVASLEAMMQAERDNNVRFIKRWRTTSANPCAICRSLNGTVKPLHEPFIQEGGAVDLDDGGVFVNTFVSMRVAQAHPNDECVIEYELETTDEV